LKACGHDTADEPESIYCFTVELARDARPGVMLVPGTAARIAALLVEQIAPGCGIDPPAHGRNAPGDRDGTRLPV